MTSQKPLLFFKTIVRILLTGRKKKKKKKKETQNHNFHFTKNQPNVNDTKKRFKPFDF